MLAKAAACIEEELVDRVLGEPRRIETPAPAMTTMPAMFMNVLGSSAFWALGGFGGSGAAVRFVPVWACALEHASVPAKNNIATVMSDFITQMLELV